jgi:riboflavin kinase / FMN adenylyltransferase
MTILTGRVVKGAGYGKELGFPTANIDRRQYVAARKRIRRGVYAGAVELPNGRRYKAGIVVGPKDSAGLPKLEAYLLGYRGNLYGKKLVFYLIKYLRPFKPYKSEPLLRAQISSDVKKIKQLTLFA